MRQRVIKSSKWVGRILLGLAFLLAATKETWAGYREMLSHHANLDSAHLLGIGGIIEALHRCFSDTMRLLGGSDE